MKKKKKAQGTELRAVLGINIRIARAQMQISQESLAEASGLSRVHIGAIERGQVACSLDVLAQIAAALDAEALDLLRPIRDAERDD